MPTWYRLLSKTRTGWPYYLASLDETKVDGVAIFAPESPQVRDAIGRLIERNIKVVRLAGTEQAMVLILLV